MWLACLSNEFAELNKNDLAMNLIMCCAIQPKVESGHVIRHIEDVVQRKERKLHQRKKRKGFIQVICLSKFYFL